MNARDFVDYLVKEKMIPSDKANTVLETMAISGDRMDTAIFDLGLATENTMLAALGRFTKSRTVTGNQLLLASPELTSLIPRRLACRFGVIPFKKEGQALCVAALDPGDFLIQDELGLLTGSMVTTFAALEIRIKEALARHYGMALSPRIERILSRISGKTSSRPPARRPRTTAPARQPPSPVETAPEAAAASEKKEATPPPAQATSRPEVEAAPVHTIPTELEISDEELALFPSLAAQQEAAGDAPEKAMPPTAAASAPTERVSEPAEETVPESPSVPAEPLTDEARLAQAADLLQSAEIRDDIADALLEFVAHHFTRTLLLTIRGDSIVGWRCEGDGLDLAAVRAIAIPKGEPSVFNLLLQGTEFWLGPLPPMPRNQELVLAMGEPAPVGCLVLPIKVRGKTVAFLYGDGGDKPLGTVPMALFKRLIAKTDIAFQVYLLKGKIRVI